MFAWEMTIMYSYAVILGAPAEDNDDDIMITKVEDPKYIVHSVEIKSEPGTSGTRITEIKPEPNSNDYEVRVF